MYLSMRARLSLKPRVSDLIPERTPHDSDELYPQLEINIGVCTWSAAQARVLPTVNYYMTNQS